MVTQSTVPTATRAESCVAAEASRVRAFDLLGKRWPGVLLGTLPGGPVGFRALARAVPGISDSVLSDRLRELTNCAIRFSSSGIQESDGSDARRGGCSWPVRSCASPARSR